MAVSYQYCYIYKLCIGFTFFTLSVFLLFRENIGSHFFQISYMGIFEEKNLKCAQFFGRLFCYARWLQPYTFSMHFGMLTLLLSADTQVVSVWQLARLWLFVVLIRAARMCSFYKVILGLLLVPYSGSLFGHSCFV